MEVELESVSLTFSFMLRSHWRTIFSFLANTSFQTDAVFFFQRYQVGLILTRAWPRAT